ncbi:MAG: NfeD family protein [Anaerovoracaceae bacterium]
MDISLFGAVVGVPVIAVWLAVAAVLAAIEAFTQGLTTIWFAGGAVAAAGMAIFVDSFLIQLLTALIVSALLLYFTRPWAVKKFNRDIVRTNIAAVIGQTGVLQDDLKAGEQGTVKADNKLWTAVLAEGEEAVKKEERVEIVAVEGVKLIVRRNISADMQR